MSKPLIVRYRTASRDTSAAKKRVNTDRNRAYCRAYHAAHKHDPAYLEKKRLQRQAWLAKNPDARREYEFKYVRDPKRWAARTLANLKLRAKQNGIEFDLTVADLKLPPVCPVLGIPIILGAATGQAAMAPNSPSVDRFDNDKGYTRANIRVISNRANILKKDATRYEILRLAAYMEGLV